MDYFTVMIGSTDIDTSSVSSQQTLTLASTGSNKGDRMMSGLGTYDGDSGDSCQPSIFIRIFVSEFNVQKCLQFPPTTGIWEVKQKLLATLPKELKDSLNYGLFCPPYNGRAGKFLDDERTLQDYPLPGNVGYLELKYKRRVYKMMNLDEKALKQLHTKSNLRKFIDYVLSGQADKITRMCGKGLDPNFHDLDNGETPLTLATTLKEPVPVLAALTNGGAHLDFRALDGCTALHRAAQHNNFKALQGLLELGSSANYKDSKGLTPLYYSATHAQDPNICQTLLYDYALIGSVDSQGWQEIHHACRNGHVRHLEHLIFYGADIDARNASGNTPLHVCAVNNQESCARVLLFRGADKNAKNYANQTAYAVAIIGGAIDLADVIKRHSVKDIVPLREKPNFNPRRRPRSRSPGSMISRTNSVSRLTSCSPSMSNGPTASPSPSNRSYMMFSTSGSVSSNGSNCENSHPGEDCSTSGVVTDKSSCSDESTCVATAHRPPNSISHISRVTDHDETKSYSRTAYTEKLRGTGNDGDGMSIKSVPVMQRADSAFSDSLTSHSRDGSPATISRGLVGLPRTVTLLRGPQGYGFVLRGSKSGNLGINRDIQVVPGDNPPALQYLDEVDRNGPAHNAGLLAGDFLLSINGEDVRTYPHERAVNLIRHAQHSVTLTVMTPPRGALRSSGSSKNRSVNNTFRKGSNASMVIPLPPRRDPRTVLTIGPERSKSYIGLNDIGSYDTITNENVKIASIRPRPVSKRITASEIEDLLVRQGSAQQNNGNTMSSFIPAPKPEGSIGSNSSRVFSSVAHMKRQRAALQQQRRRTDVVPTTVLHKDYHSTPDLSAENSQVQPMNDETEELYSDTSFGPPAEIYQNAKVVPSHSNYRSVPTTPQNPTYSRPVIPMFSAKPPALLNRQTTYPEVHQSTLHRASMQPSVSLDERTYASLSTQNTLDRRHNKDVVIYAAPDDPEPDYFSDDDRLSYGSSGRTSKPPAAALPVANIKPPVVQKTTSMPPPPPPPPAATSSLLETNSFAAAIAKAAQARRANVENDTSGTSETSALPLLKPLTAGPVVVEAKRDDFQSELMRALKRRSNDRDVESVISEARRSSTDVDTFNLRDPTENLSTVKDRISFLERQAVLGPRIVRLSGITTDQSSTDADQSSNSNSTSINIRAGIQYRAPLSVTDIDEGTANRFGVRNGVTGIYDHHDSASINSQSSASTFSSGYESPTLKYGSAGEHLWNHVLSSHQPQTKLNKPFEPVVAPPPEFC